jgi:integration host factor subunit alpha
MTKADIARSIHQQAGVSETDAADLLDRILDLFRSTLHQGEPIIITGFGRFTVHSKGPRQGRNPRTGEAMIVAARRVVTFRPSALWKAEVNADGQTSTPP